jgi:hypothetical protein
MPTWPRCAWNPPPAPASPRPWIDAAECLLPLAPPLEALELRRALIAGYERQGDRSARNEQRAAVQALLRQLAASLEDRPALQASFLARHRDLLS